MSLASTTASLLGTRLTLFIGPTLAVPAPILLTEALSAVDVSLSDEGVDGFTLTFTVGRSSVFSLDYAILSNPLLKIGNRVVIQVWLGVVPQVLIDGFITKVQLNPSDEPGQSTLTITGEDLRTLMDLHEVSMSFLGLPVEARVALILAKYALYLGMPPNVVRRQKRARPQVLAHAMGRDPPVLRRRHAAMFGDRAQAVNHPPHGEKRQQPKQRIQPPNAEGNTDTGQHQLQ